VGAGAPPAGLNAYGYDEQSQMLGDDGGEPAPVFIKTIKAGFLC
jgi:hypothetical protein